MDRNGSGTVADVLCREVIAAEHPDEVADRAVAAWSAISKAMEPIIGRRGMAALYHRSVHLSIAAYPWLAELPAAPGNAMELPVLREALARRDVGEGAATCVALITIFCSVLTSLVGESLVERLLPVTPPAPSSSSLVTDASRGGSQ